MCTLLCTDTTHTEPPQDLLLLDTHSMYELYIDLNVLHVIWNQRCGIHTFSGTNLRTYVWYYELVCAKKNTCVHKGLPPWPWRVSMARRDTPSRLACLSAQHSWRACTFLRGSAPQQDQHVCAIWYLARHVRARCTWIALLLPARMTLPGTRELGTHGQVGRNPCAHPAAHRPYTQPLFLGIW